MSSTENPTTAQHITDEQIRFGIIDVCKAASWYVRIDRIKAEWATVGVNAERIDEAIKHMIGTERSIMAIPEANQKALKPAQRAGATWIGGQWLHYVAIPGMSGGPVAEERCVPQIH